MNERIKELAEQAEEWNADGDKCEVNLAKFAELIVKECILKMDIVYAKALVDGIEGPDTFLNGVNVSIEAVNQHFGVEECRGWVCPKCGVDRTKDVCPQGHMAAVEGKCPMIGVAQ